MITTLVCISNHGDSQIHYLRKVLEQYSQRSQFEVAIVLQTTQLEKASLEQSTDVSFCVL